MKDREKESEIEKKAGKAVILNYAKQPKTSNRSLYLAIGAATLVGALVLAKYCVDRIYEAVSTISYPGN